MGSDCKYHAWEKVFGEKTSLAQAISLVKECSFKVVVALKVFGAGYKTP